MNTRNVRNSMYEIAHDANDRTKHIFLIEIDYCRNGIDEFHHKCNPLLLRKDIEDFLQNVNPTDVDSILVDNSPYWSYLGGFAADEW